MHVSRRTVVIDLLSAGACVGVLDGPAHAVLGASCRAPSSAVPQSHPLSPLSTTPSTPRSATPWSGGATTLEQYESVMMPQTPNGSMLLGYRNTSQFNSAGKLAWTSDVCPPMMLLAPALALAPSVFAHDWGGDSLTITNISVAAATPISVSAYGPGLGSTPVPLPTGGPGVQLAFLEAAQGATTGGCMQLGFRQSSGDLAVFGIIGGPINTDGTNAYVIALNSDAGDTGPGTGRPAPLGYFATSSGNSWSYEFNWPSSLLYVVYFGAAEVVAHVVLGAVAAMDGADSDPTVTLIRL
jgi:hypothetical protein